jgi:N utilization substance protein A
MQQDLNRVIEQVSKEKGIDKSILISALENAMVSAAKKTYGHQRKIEAQFNPEIGEVELFEAKTVVEAVQDPAVEITLDEARDNLDPDAQIGDELLSKLDSSIFGRIARRHKQNIVQRAMRVKIINGLKAAKGS